MREDILKEYIKAEKKRLDIEYKVYKLNKREIKKLFTQFDLKEYTLMFYDDFDKSNEKRLRFNNWVDIYGVGFWDMTQKDTNKCGYNIMKNLFLKKNYYKYGVSKYSNKNRWYKTYYKDRPMIFFFGRDIKGLNCDYFWLFRKKRNNHDNRKEKLVIKR